MRLAYLRSHSSVASETGGIDATSQAGLFAGYPEQSVIANCQQQHPAAVACLTYTHQHSVLCFMTRMPMADPPGDRDPDLLQGVRSNILQLVPGQGGQHQQASDAGGGGSDQRRVDQRHNDLHTSAAG